jgi:hypothetical protein
MPWITVIQGKSFTIKSDDPDEVSRALDEDIHYKEIASEVKKTGLYIIDVSNTDDGELCISMGKEFHHDRHIYQGLTLTLDHDVSAEETANIKSLSVRIHAVLVKLGYYCEIKDGLVISQFD